MSLKAFYLKPPAITGEIRPDTVVQELFYLSEPRVVARCRGNSTADTRSGTAVSVAVS
jgi:hypothetical protein